MEIADPEDPLGRLRPLRPFPMIHPIYELIRLTGEIEAFLGRPPNNQRAMGMSRNRQKLPLDVKVIELAVVASDRGGHGQEMDSSSRQASLLATTYN